MLTPQDLFTYGSLMCEDIMAEVADARLRCTPAILTGYRRFLVKDEQYPGVVAEATGMVAGRVYHDITPESWLRLDRFEGKMYDRRPVSVCYENGSHVLVHCFIFRPEFFHRLTETEWDYATFIKGGKTLFQQEYCGYKSLVVDRQ